jgi:putative holliday junction resolvase
MQTDMYPKVLGIDYGTKRIGVAVSYGSLAEPLMVINNAGSEKTNTQVVIESALHEIAGICQVEGAIEIVVGVSEQAMAAKTTKFAKLLQDFTHLPVCLTDETLSSQKAEQKLREARAPRRKRSGKIDHFSAALILEEWLEAKQA